MTQTGTGPAGYPTRSDDTDPALYRTLLRDARRTGRCPVLLERDALTPAGVLEQPDDVLAAIGETDADAALAGWWPGGACLPGCGECLPAELPADPAGDSYPDLSGAAETIAAAVAHLGGAGSLTMAAARRPER